MKAACRDLGLVDYKTCWDLQQTLFDELLARKGAKRPSAESSDPVLGTEKKSNPTPGTHGEAVPGAGSNPAPAPHGEAAPAAGTDDPDDAGTVLLVEHPPVYTLGKSGHAENLLVDREALERMGAQFFHIDRGGDITFHGPGQLVCYPVLDLEKLGIGLREYIEALEEAVIRTVAEYGIRAGRLAGASGVWVEDKGVLGKEKGSAPRKICAIGVRSSRYITMHGFALNVTTDLGWFSRINPCGFTDRGVTSIRRETSGEVTMDKTKELVVRFLSEILNVRIYK